MEKITLRWSSGSPLEPDRAWSVAIGPEAEQALRPLRIDRELGGWAAIDALQQIERRRQVAQRLAAQLTDAIIEMAKLRDTENAYGQVYEAADSFRARLRPDL